MVVSFMIAVPFALAPPLVGGLTPATNTTAPIRHRLPDFFEELSGTPLRQHVGVEPVGPRGCAPPLGLTARIQRFGGYATDEVALAPEPFDARHHRSGSSDAGWRLGPRTCR